MKIFICGDIHGWWGQFNIMLNKKNPDIIIQCGDFGWWPHFHNSRNFDGTRKPWNQHGIKNPNTKIYWCDGNHENHEDLLIKVKEHGRVPIEVMPNVFYMPRASTLELPNGMKLLFMGGAESIDKESRTQGVSWWPEETINQSDIYALPDIKIDAVISHTIPISLFKEETFNHNVINYKKEEPSNYALEAVLKKYEPELWYCGHFHKYYKWEIGNTTGCVLNQIPDHGWCVQLET